MALLVLFTNDEGDEAVVIAENADVEAEVEPMAGYEIKATLDLEGANIHLFPTDQVLRREG